MSCLSKNIANRAKIEQFIESLYPSQRPQAIVATEKDEKVAPSMSAEMKKAQDEAKWDTSNFFTLSHYFLFRR